MAIESILSSESIYRFTVSLIDQHGGLCLHSLHGAIFGV
mgnify:CR=1 FL=1